MDTYETIKNTIIERLENALKNNEEFHWIKPWNGASTGGLALSYQKSIPYSGLNQVSLAMLDASGGEFITFKQIKDISEKDRSVKLKKGSKGFPIYYYDQYVVKDKDGNPVKDDDDNEMKRYFLKRYTVFSRDDVEGLPSKFPAKKYEHTPEEHIHKANSYIQLYCKAKGIDLDIVEDGMEAYWRKDIRLLRLPDPSNFKSQYNFYLTAMHEMTHAEVNAESGGFGSKEYAFQELVAQIGAEMFAARIGIMKDGVQENSISYIQNWLKIVKEQPKTAIAKACSVAEKAVAGIIQTAIDEMKHNLEVENAITVQLPNGMFINLLKTDEGYNYQFIDDEFTIIEAGIINDKNINNLYEMTTFLLEDSEYSVDDIWIVNCEEINELINENNILQPVIDEKGDN